jgi:thiamine-phosphate pyrophosphorylase
LTHFHLRKPDLDIDEFRALIAEIPQQYHNRIVIHSHFQLISEFKLLGYYLSSADRENYSHLSGLNCVKSTFANNFDEINELDGKFDYFVMGSIFKSISKPGLNVKFNHEYLKSQLNQRKYQSKILAIGGIKESTTEIAINYGFDGVVILGAVWALYMETFDVSQAIEKFVRINSIAMVMKN